MARKTTENTTTNRSKKTGASLPANLVPVNLEEEIRRRAYELYLQRTAAAGGENGGGSGNENQDWLTAEREVCARYGIRERRTA